MIRGARIARCARAFVASSLVASSFATSPLVTSPLVTSPLVTSPLVTSPLVASSASDPQSERDATTTSLGASAPRDAASLAALRDAWQEALELDVPDEILAGGAWVERERDADAGLAALYARALHAAGLDERADAILARGDSAPLVLAAARIAIDRDEVSRALALLTVASGDRAGTPRFPDENECALLLGRAEARAGRFARAEPHLLRFVERAPSHVEAPQAWFLLVDAARARGDAAEALRREQARAQSAEWHAFYRTRRLQARASPNEPLPRLGLAQLWLAIGDLDRARAECAAALALDAKMCRAIETLAEVERRSGRADAARARCTEALACDGGLVEVHLTLARLARDAGDAEDAASSEARYRALGGKKAL